MQAAFLTQSNDEKLKLFEMVYRVLTLLCRDNVRNKEELSKHLFIFKGHLPLMGLRSARVIAEVHLCQDSLQQQYST